MSSGHAGKRRRVHWGVAVGVAVVGGAGLARAEGAVSAPVDGGLQTFLYRDSSGLGVETYAARARARARHLAIEVRGMLDHVRLSGRKTIDPATDRGLQRAPDAVTSASATAGGGKVADEWRREAIAAIEGRAAMAGRPLSAAITGRTSSEPDYRSASAGAQAAVEVDRRRTTLALAGAFGRDEASPVEAPPGQTDAWPAGHRRWHGSLAVGHVATPWAVVGATASLTRQWGQLASPYRRAIVGTTLYPEAVPATRLRATGGVSATLAPTEDVAFEVRLGAYGDSWGVLAAVPEARVATQVRPDVVLRAGLRHYRQRPSDFYQTVYDAVGPRMTGDVRLGPLVDTQLSLAVRRSPPRGAAVWWPELTVAYDVAMLDYEATRTRVVSHLVALSTEWQVR